jgi:hypothetical protein
MRRTLAYLKRRAGDRPDSGPCQEHGSRYELWAACDRRRLPAASKLGRIAVAKWRGRRATLDPFENPIDLAARRASPRSRASRQHVSRCSFKKSAARRVGGA